MERTVLVTLTSNHKLNFAICDISSLLPVHKPSTYSIHSSTVTYLFVPKTRTLTGDRAFHPLLLIFRTSSLPWQEALHHHHCLFQEVSETSIPIQLVFPLFFVFFPSAFFLFFSSALYPFGQTALYKCVWLYTLKLFKIVMILWNDLLNFCHSMSNQEGVCLVVGLKFLIIMIMWL